MKHVSKRLLSAVREVDTVARIGGDEFFVLATELGSKEDASKLVRKIVEQVKLPIPGIPEELPLGASVGVCIFPYDGMTTADIIDRADKAMYDVESRGKGSFSFARFG